MMGKTKEKQAELTPKVVETRKARAKSAHATAQPSHATDAKVATPEPALVVIDTTVQEWLELDDVDMKVIEFRVALVKAIRRRREGSNVTQVALARQIGTTQPNIAKIEAGGVGVSLDLLLSVFFATGGELNEVVRF